MTCKTDEWAGCYDLGWGDLLVPAAYSHPAKMSRSLVFKIVAHALEEGWLQPGQWILDPFGGVGTTALPTLMAGLNYIGVELEPKFVELGRQNIDLWNSRFSSMPKWTGQAVLLQGDSRNLSQVVSAAGLVVSSPPYSSGTVIDHDTIEKYNELKAKVVRDGKGHAGKFMTSADGYGSAPGQLGAMPPGDIQAVIGSPPFAGNSGGRGEASRNGIDSALFDRHSGGMKGGTGSDPANLDHLPMGNVQAVIGSPPYVGGGHHNDQTGAWGGAVGTGQPTGQDKSVSGYGKTNGQMGQMPEGQVSAVIASPPYAEGLGHDAGHPRLDATEDKRRAEEGSGRRNGYGKTEGQLGSMAVIASPPFADSVGSDDPDKRGGLFRDEKRRNDVNLTGTYGTTLGQLGRMKEGKDVYKQKQSQPRSSGADVRSSSDENRGYSKGVGGTRKDHRQVDETLRDQGTQAHREEQWNVQDGGEHGHVAVQENAEEGTSLRDMRGDSESSSASQGLRSLQQQPRESTGSLHELSHNVTQDGVLESDQGGGDSQEIKWSDGMGDVTKSQLGGMKAGAVSAVVGSPPFENSGTDIGWQPGTVKQTVRKQSDRTSDYGSTAGQIGATQGDTFWAAARLIVEQCYDILPPNACAIWVVKNYIKAGREVDFTGQWQALCESCGFETVHIHRAMLVKDNGEQETMAAGHDTTGTTTNLLGEEVTTAGKPMARKRNRIQHKSFFRLLAEKKGAPPIDYESVLCMVKR